MYRVWAICFSFRPTVPAKFWGFQDPRAGQTVHFSPILMRLYIYIYSNSDIYQNIKYISYFIVLMYSPICSLSPYFDIYIYQNNKTNEEIPSNSGLSEIGLTKSLHHHVIQIATTWRVPIIAGWWLTYPSEK